METNLITKKLNNKRLVQELLINTKIIQHQMQKLENILYIKDL